MHFWKREKPSQMRCARERGANRIYPEAKLHAPPSVLEEKPDLCERKLILTTPMITATLPQSPHVLHDNSHDKFFPILAFQCLSGVQNSSPRRLIPRVLCIRGHFCHGPKARPHCSLAQRARTFGYNRLRAESPKQHSVAAPLALNRDSAKGALLPGSAAVPHSTQLRSSGLSCPKKPLRRP